MGVVAWIVPGAIGGPGADRNGVVHPATISGPDLGSGPRRGLRH